MSIVWNAIVLSAPAVKVDPKVAKPHLVALAGVLSAVVPKLAIPGDKIDPEDVCRDPKIGNDRMHYRSSLQNFSENFVFAEILE